MLAFDEVWNRKPCHSEPDVNHGEESHCWITSKPSLDSAQKKEILQRELSLASGWRKGWLASNQI